MSDDQHDLRQVGGESVCIAMIKQVMRLRECPTTTIGFFLVQLGKRIRELASGGRQK
jgi:hypothetical protein